MKGFKNSTICKCLRHLLHIGRDRSVPSYVKGFKVCTIVKMSPHNLNIGRDKSSFSHLEGFKNFNPRHLFYLGRDRSVPYYVKGCKIFITLLMSSAPLLHRTGQVRPLLCEAVQNFCTPKMPPAPFSHRTGQVCPLLCEGVQNFDYVKSVLGTFFT